MRLRNNDNNNNADTINNENHNNNNNSDDGAGWWMTMMTHSHTHSLTRSPTHARTHDHEHARGFAAETVSTRRNTVASPMATRPPRVRGGYAEKNADPIRGPQSVGEYSQSR